MALVLVVDDYPDIRDCVASLLKDEGHEVLTAEDGPDALRLLESHEPHLVLLDISMPGMSGLQVLEELRRRRRRPPVVMMTALADEATRVRAAELGAVGYMVKGRFDLEELNGCVEQLCGAA